MFRKFTTFHFVYSLALIVPFFPGYSSPSADEDGLSSPLYYSNSPSSLQSQNETEDGALSAAFSPISEDEGSSPVRCDPHSFIHILETSYPFLFWFESGEKNHATADTVISIAENLQSRLSDVQIETVFSLGAQYGHIFQSSFDEQTLQNVLQELGAIESQYPGSSTAVYHTMQEESQTGLLPEWKDQKTYLRTAAFLYNNLANAQHPSIPSIVHHVNAFTPNDVTEEQHRLMLSLLINLVKTFPQNYNDILIHITETYDRWEQYIGSLCSVKLISITHVPPHVHNAVDYRPGSGLQFDSPPSPSPYSDDLSFTPTGGPSTPPLKTIDSPEPRPYPVSPSLPVGMDRYPFPPLSVQLSPPPIGASDEGFYPSSPSLPIGLGSPYHP